MAKLKAKSKEQRVRGKEHNLSLQGGAEAISKNEKGIALVMVLVLSTIVLVIMAGLIYMLTTGTQLSGMQKRYKTALEAGIGGADITYQIMALRGETSATSSLLSEISVLNPVLTTPSTCATLSSDPSCTIVGNYAGLAAKLNLPTSCWSGCNSSLTIDPGNATTYDMQFDIGTAPTYRVYAKIVDTVEGNSGGDEGLIKGGVVHSSGEINVASIPFLYTIEVDAQNQANPAERAKLSILYQY
jgi:hypothetical protein